MSYNNRKAAMTGRRQNTVGRRTNSPPALVPIGANRNYQGVELYPTPPNSNISISPNQRLPAENEQQQQLYLPIIKDPQWEYIRQMELRVMRTNAELSKSSPHIRQLLLNQGPEPNPHRVHPYARNTNVENRSSYVAPGYRAPSFAHHHQTNDERNPIYHPRISLPVQYAPVQNPQGMRLPPYNAPNPQGMGLVSYNALQTPSPQGMRPVPYNALQTPSPQGMRPVPYNSLQTPAHQQRNLMRNDDTNYGRQRPQTTVSSIVPYRQVNQSIAGIVKQRKESNQHYFHQQRGRGRPRPY